jgi:zinc and cadmium transporter
MLLNILFFTFLASVVSLFLVAILLLQKKLINKFSFYLVSFAAGALLATAFLDTLKESVNQIGDNAYLLTTIFIAVFFIIERAFLFLHHHDDEEEDLRIPTQALLFGDGLHNFIDGASIAAGFMVNFQLGLITSVAVFVHEIPHELGDFGILIHKKWARGKILGFNFLTGCMAILGALIAFYFGSKFENITGILLAITSGNFIYLSAVDLLPEIHHKAKRGLAIRHSLSFVMGILIIALLVKFLAD